MIVSEIKLFELLKAKMGQQEAEAFVTLLETKVDRKFEEAKDLLATKEDISKLETRISEKFNDQLKWMIVMWVTQLGALITIIKFIH